MSNEEALEGLRQRRAPLEMATDEFREIGHRLVDEIADRLAALPDGPVMRDESPADLRRVLGAEQTLPPAGADAGRLVSEATDLLFDHSLFNGHPRFFGYITSSPAPIGMFGDFLAAALNQNVGAWRLAPLATEIEGQTVRWIAELIGFPASCGGLLVSGGNMANFVCFLAARAAKARWDVRKEGLSRDGRQLLRLRLDRNPHVDPEGRRSLRARHRRDPLDCHRRRAAHGRRRACAGRSSRTSGSAISRFSSSAPPDRSARASSIRFRTSPPSAGNTSCGSTSTAPTARWRRRRRERRRACARSARPIRSPSIRTSGSTRRSKPAACSCAMRERLRNAFSYHPTYYHFDEQVVNYFDYGPQNSRGFRALKVWLALRQVGRAGYLQMIGDDILLARHLHQIVAQHPEFEAATQNLSITTFRYVPPDLRPQLGSADGRGLSQPVESESTDGGREERRGIPVQRARRRQISLAGLHRQLSHVAGGYRSAAAALVAIGTGDRCGSEAERPGVIRKLCYWFGERQAG